MHRVGITFLAIVFAATPALWSERQAAARIHLEHADQVEVLLRDSTYLTYVVGHVAFQTETGRIYCDSAIWHRGQYVHLRGNVLVDDQDYRMVADSAFYDLLTREAVARGSDVQLWSYEDSLYAAGTHAYFDRRRDFFFMEERPLLYLKYPDSARMVEVIADRIQYDGLTEVAEATGRVVITSQDIASESDCAIMNVAGQVLDLYGAPRARRGESVVTGDLISIVVRDDTLRTIDVIDSAHGEFTEPVDSAQTDFDRSTLKGRRIILTFENGELDRILCYGQAYSWYYPSTRGSNEFNENSVSGDTIRFTVRADALTRVDVIGGAIGTFITGKMTSDDTLEPPKADTIDYSSQYIHYDVTDSVITLVKAGHVQSGTVALDAHEIRFDTRRRVIEAYSAEIDTLREETQAADTLPGPPSLGVLPNTVPVMLRDKEEQIFGDYLEYSLDTEKGRIVQSKSSYEAGYYYGRKLFREQKHIFYVDAGRYTTCELGEPHYHFYSTSMKLIEGDKLIAKPVVFYLGRIPVLAIPYYVFPLKKGRHSGFLPFTFGRFERGERYVRNVGYYWAASEFWDWQGSLDYLEQNRTMIFNSSINVRKRYVLDGRLTGSYSRVGGYNRLQAVETRTSRWAINGRYSHTVSPSFNIAATGSFQSDKSYFTDYSSNLEERLNRDVKSQVSFAKRFGREVSLSGQFTHTVNLDRESRSDVLPSATFSLPTIWIFGNGSRDADGQLRQRWFHNFTFRYTPSLIHVSNRQTVDVTETVGFDTTMIEDTTFVGDSILVDTSFVVSEIVDSSSYRSRRKYLKINHNPRIGLPTLTLARYFRFTPSVNYSETWIKVFETDQSGDELIDASKLYRTYSFSSSLAFKTAVYGTVYPNLFGVSGLRHVFEPSLTYSYAPEIDKHPDVRRFVGGGAGSRKTSVLGVSVRQIFQAKLRKGEIERNLELLSVTSGFTYNFEADTLPYSDLSTSFQTSTIPGVRISGGMSHTFYDPHTGELRFWSPFLEGFKFDVAFSLNGKRFFFDDDVEPIPRGAPTVSDVGQSAQPSAPQGWRLSVTYGYSESGRGTSFSKSSLVRFNLSFNLTPSTSVNYAQQYDIVGAKTVSSQVRIERSIHCWTGSLWWVPTGSNRGFGFRLNVTALPEVKVDQNFDTFDSGLLQR